MCLALALTGLAAAPGSGQPHGQSSTLTRAHSVPADFRTNFPAAVAGLSDQDLLQLAGQTCADIAAGMFWPQMLTRVQARYGVDALVASGMLSLVGSHCSAPIRQP